MQYYRSKSKESITCLLCRHSCELKEAKGGICGVNINKEGRLKNLVYNYPSALHIDPIEKKPLYHFLAGSKTFSLGTVGCNFHCPFCQNYAISQIHEVDTRVSYTPKEIVSLALKYQTQSISYTYNEPTIWYPYAKDIGMLAQQEGLKNIFVSNGFESVAVLEDMTQWVDAINIDLKSFSKHYYKQTLKADLDGVLETLRFIAHSSIHLEITSLLIPNINDSIKEVEQMARFIAEELGTEIPWHLSAFHPDYKMQDTAPTELKVMQRSQEIAYKYGIKHVYLGNVMSAI